LPKDRPTYQRKKEEKDRREKERQIQTSSKSLFSGKISTGSPREQKQRPNATYEKTLNKKLAEMLKKKKTIAGMNK